MYHRLFNREIKYVAKDSIISEMLFYNNMYISTRSLSTRFKTHLTIDLNIKTTILITGIISCFMIF